MSSSQQQLQQAYQLIRQEQRTEAMQILVQLVREDPNNADAWWLLANAVTNTDQQRRAVEQVLRLRPGDDKAQRMMAKLTGAPTPPAALASYSEPTMVASAPPRPPADPFAPPSQSQSQRRAEADPFASSDPFAAPQSSASQSQRRAEPDPFASADPFGGSTGRAAPAAPPRKRKTDDPFDDPFSDPPTNAYPPDRARRMSEVGVPRRRRSGCATCFIIFGVLALVLCGVCTIATFALPSAIRPIFNQVADALETQSPASGAQFRSAINAIYSGDADAAATALNGMASGLTTEVALTIAANPQLRDARGTLEAGGSIAPNLQLTLEAASAGIAGFNLTFGGGSANAVDKGAIEIGQTVRDTLPAGNNGYRYRLSGVNANQPLTLTATADNDLDVVIEVYPADGSDTVADLDGGMRGDTEVLEWTPTRSGSYNVVVRGFAGGAGAFTLEVTRP